MLISDRIFSIMEQKGISQMEFSKSTGISQSTISDWKRKGTNPGADKIMTICNALDVTPYEVLQDFSQEQKSSDVLIVSKGSRSYDLLIKFESLKPRKMERLLGYLDALRE